MNIIACARRVPTLESTIKLLPSPPVMDTSGITYMTNPFDEYAIEEGIRIKERLGGGELTVVTVGPEGADQMILNALAMGADRAVYVHVKEEVSHRCVTLIVSFILPIFGTLKFLPFNPCGKEAVD